ncbi:MAG: tetratricopeptide repeat protein [Planctomycetes bacterium]|nr:tetratricopeptide repeat protein [Planctomycetota bacterium]MBI3846398.1 tetratricopeptide repeat protein [Planctomycetota bacterium]
MDDLNEIAEAVRTPSDLATLGWRLVRDIESHPADWDGDGPSLLLGKMCEWLDDEIGDAEIHSAELPERPEWSSIAKMFSYAFIEAREHRSSRTYSAAREAFNEGAIAKAIELVRKSIDENDHYKSRELLGQCLEVQGDVERALEEYRAALILNPRSDKTACLFADCLIRTGRRDEARAVLESTLQRTPTYGPARKLLEGLT